MSKVGEERAEVVGEAAPFTARAASAALEEGQSEDSCRLAAASAWSSASRNAWTRARTSIRARITSGVGSIPDFASWISWLRFTLAPWTFFFSSRRRHTRCGRDWSSDVCSSDLSTKAAPSSVSKRLYERPICQSAVCKNVGISLSPGKPFDHRLANLILIQFFTINGHICVTSVQSKTLIKKLRQRLLRPAGYPSRAVIANPFDDTLQGNIKKHHRSDRK